MFCLLCSFRLGMHALIALITPPQAEGGHLQQAAGAYRALSRRGAASEPAAWPWPCRPPEAGKSTCYACCIPLITPAQAEHGHPQKAAGANCAWPWHSAAPRQQHCKTAHVPLHTQCITHITPARAVGGQPQRPAGARRAWSWHSAASQPAAWPRPY